MLADGTAVGCGCESGVLRVRHRLAQHARGTAPQQLLSTTATTKHEISLEMYRSRAALQSMPRSERGRRLPAGRTRAAVRQKPHLLAEPARILFHAHCRAAAKCPAGLNGLLACR